MGFFKTLFNRNPKLPLADLSVLHTDVHSHLIPGLDDGAKTIEESVDLIRELHLLGYKKLITTPHIMSDYYKNTPKMINEGLAKLRKAVSKEGIPVELEAAAEYYIDYDFEARIEQKNLLTFGGDHVLIELSFLNLPENLQSVLFKLQTSGYKPVLAHVERYPYWNDLEIYKNIRDSGVFFQLNIMSLSHSYAPPVRKIARMLIDNDMVDLLGTDCHNMEYIERLKEGLTDRSIHDVLASEKLMNNKL